MEDGNNENAGRDSVKELVDAADCSRCIICQLVLGDSEVDMECSHRFCSNCFEKMKKYAALRGMNFLHNPRDHAKGDADDKGEARVTLESKMKVRCNNHSEGCNWIGELRDLQNHLDKECVHEEKKFLFQLLLQLEKRVESCEKRLSEKDVQIIFLQEESKCYRESLDEKEKQIEVLQKDSKHQRESLDEKETQIRILRRDLKLYTDYGNSKDAEIEIMQQLLQNNLSLNETCISEESMELHVKDPNSHSNPHYASQVKINQDIKDRLVALEKHVLNVQEYNVNDNYVAFEWKMVDYSAHRDVGKAYSPMFYSGINGCCFKLFVKWYGSLKNRLGVYLIACEDIWQACSPPPPHLTFKIETWDGNGEMVSFHSKSYDKAYYTIEFDRDESKGRGTSNFISSSLPNFIKDDSITLRCTLFLDKI